MGFDLSADCHHKWTRDEMMPEIRGISVTGKVLCQEENEQLVDELDVRVC